MIRNLTRTVHHFLCWRGVALVCLSLLLALDDSARCWRLALDHASARGNATPDDSDEEEALAKQPHRAAVASRRTPNRKRPPRPAVDVEMAVPSSVCAG